jgi:hypothetical protein
MARVSLTRVRRAHHVDVADAGIVSLDVALQLVKKCAMRLSWVTERLRCVSLRHTSNYAEGGRSRRHLPVPAHVDRWPRRSRSSPATATWASTLDEADSPPVCVVMRVLSSHHS